MFRALVFSAAAAGCCGGLIVSIFQWAIVTPLILEAETFETGVTIAGHGSGGLDYGRTALTILATIVYSTGLALVLLGLMVFARAKITMDSALAWGVAGFFAVALAPALGLPPVVPGIPEAPLMERQIWWAGTALATMLGIWAIMRMRTWPWVVLGVALILVPHLIGAPHPEVADSDVPTALAGRFVAASLSASALLWICVPAFSGLTFNRMSAVRS